MRIIAYLLIVIIAIAMCILIGSCSAHAQKLTTGHVTQRIDTSKLKFWGTAAIMKLDSQKCRICKKIFQKWDAIAFLKIDDAGFNISMQHVHLECVLPEKPKAKFR